MSRIVGVLVMEHIAAGAVTEGKVAGAVCTFPEKMDSPDVLLSMPLDGFVECIAKLAEKVAESQKIDAIGIGFPGIIRDGVVEESPNLKQVKGFPLQKALSSALSGNAAGAAVRIFNDADVMAAGIASTQRKLNRLIRVWTLGNGVGFGRYPSSEGVWEGGHSVVTLDPRESFCGCGGRGHLEGILGRRSMRLRFLDMEPEEVFEHARAGDVRCSEFVMLCHRALAAATATCIHMEGPGTIYVTGPDVKFIDIALLDRLLHEMVKMSPLQGSRFEIVPTTDEMGIVGAAVNVQRELKK
jgi:glucokinase